MITRLQLRWSVYLSIEPSNQPAGDRSSHMISTSLNNRTTSWQHEGRTNRVWVCSPQCKLMYQVQLHSHKWAICYVLYNLWTLTKTWNSPTVKQYACVIYIECIENTDYSRMMKTFSKWVSKHQYNSTAQWDTLSMNI